MLLWTPGWGELVIIFFIVLLLFGGKKLPSLARSIGSGINEFKRGLSGQLPDDSANDDYSNEQEHEASTARKTKTRSNNKKT